MTITVSWEDDKVLESRCESLKVQSGKSLKASKDI